MSKTSFPQSLYKRKHNTAIHIGTLFTYRDTITVSLTGFSTRKVNAQFKIIGVCVGSSSLLVTGDWRCQFSVKDLQPQGIGGGGRRFAVSSTSIRYSIGSIERTLSQGKSPDSLFKGVSIQFTFLQFNQSSAL